MKKFILIISACVMAGSLMAASVKVEYSGPSGQGDIAYVAPATTVTNMAMGTGGLYNVTLDPRYPITGVGLLPGNVTLANTYMIIGNASSVGAANTPAAVRTNLSLVVGSNVQAYDADLTTWAGISPSANAQALMLLTYAAMRTNLNLVIGTDVQAYDADLTTWAGITPSANAQALLLLTYGAMRTNLTLVVGTDVQAYDADLTTWAGISPSANMQALALLTYAAMRTNLNLVIGTDVQAWDADLDTWAGVTSSANGRSLVSAVDYSAMRTNLSLVIGSDVLAYDANTAARAGSAGKNMTNTFYSGALGVTTNVVIYFNGLLTSWTVDGVQQ